MSDLHLEASRHPDTVLPARPVFDVLLVAGDVWEDDMARALVLVAEL